MYLAYTHESQQKKPGTSTREKLPQEEKILSPVLLTEAIDYELHTVSTDESFLSGLGHWKWTSHTSASLLFRTMQHY